MGFSALVKSVTISPDFNYDLRAVLSSPSDASYNEVLEFLDVAPDVSGPLAVVSHAFPVPADAPGDAVVTPFVRARRADGFHGDATPQWVPGPAKIVDARPPVPGIGGVSVEISQT